MVFYRSKVVSLSMDHICSVVYDVNAKNKYDIIGPLLNMFIGDAFREGRDEIALV